MILRVLQSLALLAAVAVFAPNSAEAQQCNMSNLRPGLNDNCAINVGGRNRVFDVIVPQNVRPDAPVVLDFHGFGGNENIQRRASGLSRLVQAEGIILATPRGIATSFNGQTCCGTAQQQRIDDVAFARGIVRAVSSSLRIQPVVVASSGISNGMTMSNKLACQAGDTFDLVAGVSFQLQRNLASVCRPAPGTIYSEFHATADNIVPFNGSRLNVQNAAQAPRSLAQIRGCNMQPQQARLNGNTTCTRFTGCDGGGLVEMCTVTPGNHNLYPTVAGPVNFAGRFQQLLRQAIQAKGGAVAN